MTAMMNIKSIINKRSKDSLEIASTKKNKKSSLKEVINAANDKQARADKIETLATLEELEDQLVQDIAHEIDLEFNVVTDLSKITPPSVDINGNKIKLDEIIEDIPEKSEHVLELQRKQNEMQEMYAQMQHNSHAFETLLKKSEQISDYLIKSEIELSRLENIENQYQKLHTASEQLAKAHRELKTKLEEKYNQVSLLEGQKSKNRDTIDKIQLEINRLTEENKSKTAEMHSQEILISKLKDENLSAHEKIGILSFNNSELSKQTQELKDKLDATQNTLSNSEKQLSKANMKIETLTNDLERNEIDNLDIQARYKSLNDKHAETTVSLEEVKYELTSERNSFDEKLRLKDARIMKMERRIEVLTRQVSLTEQLVNDFDDKKSEKTDLKIRDKKELKCQSAKKAAKKPDVSSVKNCSAMA